MDCGSNFESVSCSLCSYDVTDAWQKWMEAASHSKFEDLSVQMPCCGKPSDLNSMRYDWPVGFAKFVLEVRNPGVGGLLSDVAVREVERVLGVPVRQVLARY